MRQLAKALLLGTYNGIITHVPFYAIRHAYLRILLGVKVGSGVAIHTGCTFSGRVVRIGAGSVINRNCVLDGRGGLEIGRQVSISPECCLLSLTHDPQSADFKAFAKPLRIGDRAWLGTRALVLPGAHIGEGAVVGAGSVVSKPVDPFTMVAGNPAKKIGDRTRDLTYTLKYFPLFNTDVHWP